MPTTAPSPSRPIQPVVVGGDIGAYSVARSFHEAYGVRSVVVSAVQSALVRHSCVLDHVAVPEIRDPEALVDALRAVARQHDESGQPGRLVLLASADRLVRTLSEHRERLDDQYVVPYADHGLLTRVTDKAEFSGLCATVGVPHPDTVVVDTADPATVEDAVSRHRFPVVAKAASTVAYESARFEGKRKVFVIDTPDDLRALVRRVSASGWAGRLVVQDRIPGGDTGMRILTTYSDRSGGVRYASFGHVLLEEHAPTALGNPAAILTDHDEQVVDDARRLLEHLGWTGYANFDLKLDPRTGKSVFFELNPRLGRSNHYVTAGGLNPVTTYVREHVEGLPPVAEGQPDHGLPGALFTVLPRPLLESYVDDPGLRDRVAEAYRTGRVHDPLRYVAERDPRRRAYVTAARLNQYRKFRRYYPVAQARQAASVPA